MSKYKLWILLALTFSLFLLSYFLNFSHTQTPASKTINEQPSPAAATAPHPINGLAINDLLGKNEVQLHDYFKEVREIGFTAIRTDFVWHIARPSKSKPYNWKQYDLIVKSARGEDLKIVGIIDYTPVWARRSECLQSDKCAPKDTESYITFVSDIAKRYKGKVIAWEIWNEENTFEFWLPKPDPKTYTEILKESYKVIKSADKNTSVVIGGMIPGVSIPGKKYDATSFLNELYLNSARDSFDAIAYHPYTYPNDPAAGVLNWDQLDRLRNVMVSHADSDKKIWVTEFGAPTNGPVGSDFISEAKQASMVPLFYNTLRSKPWIGPIFWYTFQDMGTTTSTKENFFGIKRKDGSSKPAYAAWKLLLNQ